MIEQTMGKCTRAKINNVIENYKLLEQKRASEHILLEMDRVSKIKIVPTNTAAL